MDRASKGMMDWFDKHEGRAEGSSFKGINKERERQGYKAHKDPNAHAAKKELAKKIEKKKDAVSYINEKGKKMYGASARSVANTIPE